MTVKKSTAKKRQGVFVGAYIPRKIKNALRAQARAKHWTLTKLLNQILDDATNVGKVQKKE